MKRFLIIIAILALIAPLCAQDTGVDGWRALKATYFTMHAVDLGLTYSGLHSGLSEWNPAVKLYIERPGAGYAVGLGLTIAISHGADYVWRRNKALGWVVLGVLTVFKAWVVWHNWREIR